jgi:UDP-N-acetylmuramyl-tripeptide synthetase
MVELQHPVQAAQWLRDHVRGELRTDSRHVQPGDGFIAWPGAATDGRHYMAQALAQGASVCLMQREGCEPWQDLSQDRLAALPGLKERTGLVAAAYYEEPSHDLGVMAVTGTNGKTSSACWLAQILAHPALGERCGVVGTLGVGLWPDLVYTGLTTPDPVLLQRSFRQMVDSGAQWCAIEASSIGIAEHRLDGTRIRTAVFTNFTQDHLDYHGSMQAYWAAKRQLFAWEGLRSVVINIDDPQGAALAAELADTGLDLWTCSRHQPARLRARALPSREGLSFELQEGEACQRIDTHLTGAYNIDNLLGVVAALRAQGLPLAQIAVACADVQPVPGRMQRVCAPGVQTDLPLAVVDYAHTPDALAQALQALQALAQTRGGRLWCVFGCGGDRDPHKRPLMAAAAEALADHVVLTSDNPRNEPAAAILAQMVAGLQRASAATVIEDRAKAIAHAVREAGPADVLLVAGKGHETTQEIAGVFLPFSDVTQLVQALAVRGAQEAQA